MQRADRAKSVRPIQLFSTYRAVSIRLEVRWYYSVHKKIFRSQLKIIVQPHYFQLWVKLWNGYVCNSPLILLKFRKEIFRSQLKVIDQSHYFQVGVKLWTLLTQGGPQVAPSDEPRGCKARPAPQVGSLRFGTPSKGFFFFPFFSNLSTDLYGCIYFPRP